MSMTSTDPIADMLTRIRNAIAVNKYSVTLPHSNLKESVAAVLKQNNFVDNVATQEGATGFKELVVTINSEGTNARITEINRMSTPGRRLYSSSETIPVVKRGRGIVVISTSKGMMTGADAKAQGLGGELICKVY